MDLSLYKDEAQLDKTPRKRKRDAKSESEDYDDEDYDELPHKKRIVKRASPSKRSAAKKLIVNDESTESDEENLMEIKKKANKVRKFNEKEIIPKLSFISRLQAHQPQKLLPRLPNRCHRPAKLRLLQPKDENELRRKLSRLKSPLKLLRLPWKRPKKQ